MADNKMADNKMADKRMAGNETAGGEPLDDKPVGRERDKSTGPARPRPPFPHPNKMDVKTNGARRKDERASGAGKPKEHEE